MALRLAQDFIGLKVKEYVKDKIVLENNIDKVDVPLIDGVNLLINWRGKWVNTYKHYSFLDILQAYKDMEDGKVPKIDVEPLKNSICLVGLTALGLYDIKPVPMEPAYPSIGVLATAIDNILNQQFIKIIPMWLYYLAIFMLALVPPFLIFEERPLREILSILFVILFFVMTFLVFKKDYWVPYVLPLLSLIVCYIVVAAYNFARVTAERATFLKLAVTDELTQLYNIRYFNTILDNELMMARNDKQRQFCVLMGDIDFFKQFNDSYGHQVGDLVLQEVCALIKRSVRGSDIVARYGGEEIIVLLRTPYFDAAWKTAEEVRYKIENLEIMDEFGKEYKTTMSFGLAKYLPEDDRKSIVKRTDDSLYEAKHAGRNCCRTIQSGGLK